ncbi:MAG: zinc dependent phospholipase C family protein [Bacilli bacterium]|nr:zinc dependent phospholipase C family protein [Bacilli bacterium]
MAGTITHAYFANDLYKKLDKKTKNKLKNYKENLKTYNQGHDIFFFTFNVINHNTRKIGNYMHKNNTKEFFKNIIIYIKKNNLENNSEIMSFLYGFIGHYALDSTVHPYVTYKTGVFKKKDKKTYKYNSKHSDLESYIDAYMINKHEKITPNKFKIHKFCFNTKLSKELSKLIDYAFYKTYNFKHMSLLIKEGIFNMKVSYRVLRYDPYKIKKNAYNFIDKILPKSLKKLSPISYAYELNNNEYYLNLDHKKWCHPRYKDETYTYSFLDLYNNALDMAIDIINNVNDILYNNKSINDLDNIFLNISFASGKECNDKTKNKYFEY